MTIDPNVEPELRRLVAHVLEVNKSFNLTAIRDENEAWIKHIHDSLQGLSTGLFEGEKQVVDIGSGAGFPGLPLALARPQLKVVLLEATRKKADFLTATAADFSPRTRILCGRAEAIAHKVEWRERFAVATMRAVGSMSEACELALPLIKIGGHAVLWRGTWAREEAKAMKRVLSILGGAVRDVTPYKLEGLPLTYHLVVIEKTHVTPEELPRRDGLPKHEPLVSFSPPG